MELPKNLTENEHLILILIFLVGFGFYLYILTRHLLIYGIDGPYYLVQVEHLLKNGSLKHGDPPLAFLIFAFFTLVLNGNTTLGIRVGLALVSALSAIPAYFYVKKVSNSQLCGYVAMLVCVFAAPHVRLLNDLLKNAVGILFLLCFVYYLHLISIEGEHSKKNLLFAAVFLVLTGATHVLDFGVALLFLTIYMLTGFFFLRNWKKLAKNAVVLLAIVGLFAAGALITFPSLFTDFFKGVSFLQDLFFEEAGEAPPIFFLFDPVGGSFILPILLVGAVLCFYEWKKGNELETLALAAATLVGALLAFPLIPPEWLWRFLLMEFISMSFILGIAVSKIEKRIVLVAFLLLCVFPLILQGIGVSKNMRPTIREDDYWQLEIISLHVPSNSVIIVDFMYGYWVEYLTGEDIAKKFSLELRLEYAHVLMLIDKLSPRVRNPPHGSIKLVETKRYALYEIP